MGLGRLRWILTSVLVACQPATQSAEGPRVSRTPAARKSPATSSATPPQVKVDDRTRDSDRDGLPDVEDSCPEKPGPRNPEKRWNGCPTKPIANLPMNGIDLEPIEFAPGSAKLKLARRGES